MTSTNTELSLLIEAIMPTRRAQAQMGLFLLLCHNDIAVSSHNSQFDYFRIWSIWLAYLKSVVSMYSLAVDFAGL